MNKKSFLKGDVFIKIDSEFLSKNTSISRINFQTMYSKYIRRLFIRLHLKSWRLLLVST